MTDSQMTSVPESLPETMHADQAVDAALRAELARGDMALSTLTPVLTHFLNTQDRSLFSDSIIARVRGMLRSASYRLLRVEADEIGATDVFAYAEARADALGEELARHAAFLGHCHALAIEWQLAERLRGRNGIDPILSPLLQSLIVSEDAELADAAMGTLAAQARFIEQQKRMEMPLAELPEDQFANFISVWRRQRDDLSEDLATTVETRIRQMRAENEARLSLLDRTVARLDKRADVALSLTHAGAAVFLTALAHGAGQERDIVVVSTNDRQLVRFGLSLRAAGLNPAETRAQLRCLHPDATMPAMIEKVATSDARALLESSPFGHAE
ncbi:hypothetical protein AAG596_12470 [Citromicrobium bathyomarinum]|uniref:hypothetical protein n=1 Tax=Citromicrobium bathyomarinum TaxID=72174 RepID=UPI00315A9610